MRVLVLGAGLVGRELSARLSAKGHDVGATTTTPAKVDGLKVSPRRCMSCAALTSTRWRRRPSEPMRSSSAWGPMPGGP